MPSNLARKSARRKQQTRLTFDAIAPDVRSSPLANMSPAKVRYQLPNPQNTPSSSRPSCAAEDSDESDDVLSSSKNRLAVKGKATGTGKTSANKGIGRDGKLLYKALPTPVKSSQAVDKWNGALDTIESDEGELKSINIRSDHQSPGREISNTMGSSSSRLRTRPSVSYADDSDGSPPEDEVETPSKKNNKVKKKGFSLRTVRGSDEDEIDGLPQRLTRSTRSTRASKSALNPLERPENRRQISVTLSSDSDDELVFHVSKYSKDSKKRKANKPIRHEAAADDDEEFDIPQPTSSISRRRRNSIVSDDGESVADGPVVSKLMQYSQSPQMEKSKNQAIIIGDDSDEDPIKSSLPQRKPRISIPADEDEDSDPITSPLMAKKRRQPSGESEVSDTVKSPQKRRRQANDDEEDEDSDLPSLKNISSRGHDRAKSVSSTSDSTPTRITRQAKGRKHRTAKEKQMELLRRKRAGEDIEELTDSTDTSDVPKRGIYDSDSDLETLSNFEDESELEEEPDQPRKKPKKTANNDSYHLSEDSDFVVDDDDGPLGVPHLGLMDIPLQFRHAAHKPMKEHFKDAIEWMVHRKINPAFSRGDEIYLQSFRKLDDEYQGYAKSKFVSTQWTAEFTKAIYARPIFIERGCAEGEGYTLDGVPKCDVCNHRKHYPKFMIHFEGKAYHKSTLEEVERESEDSDDDDTQSVNSIGQSLPSEDKEWSSGNICRDNAQQAHALIHWKYALNEWVIDQLEREGYLTPDNLAEREKMKAKQRRDYANNLVDGWESDGVIKNLYGDFKRQLEAARESKQGRWERSRLVGFGG